MMSLVGGTHTDHGFLGIGLLILTVHYDWTGRVTELLGEIRDKTSK